MKCCIPIMVIEGRLTGSDRSAVAAAHYIVRAF